MLEILRGWFRTYFSDEEAVYLFLVLLVGLLVVIFFGRMLAPVITAIVLAYLMQGLVNNLVRKGLGETPALYLVYALFITLLLLFLLVMVPMIWKQTLTLVQDQLPRLVSSGEDWLRQLPNDYPRIISEAQANQLSESIRREVAQAGQSVLTLSLASIPGLVQVMVDPVITFFVPFGSVTCQIQSFER